METHLTMNTRSGRQGPSNTSVQLPFTPGDDTDSADESKNSKKAAKRKREQKSNPYAKKYSPGGELHDYFFESAPKWTVGGALRRLLTKVRHNPNSTISIHKFIKDSCKGNLKDYFTLVRNSMNRGDTMVMAEVAYKSFVQLAEGDKPLLRVIPPKHKPRSRAAAVSEEGYAYKDYAIQVTKFGFDLMNAKMVFDEFSEDAQPPRKKHKQPNTHTEANTSNHTNTMNNVMHQSQLEPSMPNMVSSGLALPEQFVPNITEQEHEVANNMILYLKVHIDGLLATIHHLRTENENLKKEKMERQQLGEILRYECMVLKNQLRLTQQGSEEDHNHTAAMSMMLGVVGSLNSDAFPSPGVCSGSPSYSDSQPVPGEAPSATIIGVGGMSATDATVNYLASMNSFLSSDTHYPLVSMNGGAPVPINGDENIQ